MNGLKKAVVALGLVGLLSSPYLLSKANAEEPKQVTSQLEEKASLFGTKEPDEGLYKIIDSMNTNETNGLVKKRQYDEAIKILSLLEQINNYNLLNLDKEKKKILSDSYNNLGVAFAGLGNYNLNFQTEKAIISYKKAVQLNPNNDVAHDNLAFLYHELKIYEKALQEIDIALKLNPNNFIYKIEKKKILEEMSK